MKKLSELLKSRWQVLRMETELSPCTDVASPTANLYDEELYYKLQQYFTR